MSGRNNAKQTWALLPPPRVVAFVRPGHDKGHVGGPRGVRFPGAGFVASVSLMLEPLLELLHRGRRSWIAGLGGKQTSSSSCSVVATGFKVATLCGTQKVVE